MYQRFGLPFATGAVVVVVAVSLIEFNPDS
jgi:hypothetical protein